MMRLVAQTPNVCSLPQARLAMGASLLQTGDLVAAEGWLSEGIALYQADRHAQDSTLCTYDAKVVLLAHRGWALAWLGFLDRALEQVTAAIAWATAIEHPWSLGLARHFALRVHQWRGEIAAVKALAEDNIALNQQYHFPFFGAGARILQSWVRCVEGDFERGIGALPVAIAVWPKLGGSPTIARCWPMLFGAGSNPRPVMPRRCWTAFGPSKTA